MNILQGFTNTFIYANIFLESKGISQEAAEEFTRNWAVMVIDRAIAGELY